MAESGFRILVLAHSEQETEGTKLPEGLKPVALFLLTDVIRAEAPDTLAFFDSQGVDLKVISEMIRSQCLPLPKRQG